MPYWWGKIELSLAGAWLPKGSTAQTGMVLGRGQCVFVEWGQWAGDVEKPCCLGLDVSWSVTIS